MILLTSSRDTEGFEYFTALRAASTRSVGSLMKCLADHPISPVSLAQIKKDLLIILSSFEGIEENLSGGWVRLGEAG